MSDVAATSHSWTVAALMQYGRLLEKQGRKFPVHYVSGKPATSFVARELGVPAYRLDSKAAKQAMDQLCRGIGAVAVLTMSTDVAALADLADYSVKHNHTVPYLPSGKPCFRSIALLTGVPLKYVRDEPKVRAIIDYWRAAVPELGSTPALGSGWCRPVMFAKAGTKVLVYLDTPARQTIAGPGVFRVKTTNVSQDTASVNVYLEQLKEAGMSLPALPGTSMATADQTDDAIWSAIDLSAISNDCRLSNTKVLRVEPFRARLIGAARAHGLTTHSEPDCTVKTFKEKAMSWRLAEVKVGKAPASAKQQVYNMTAALDAFVRFVVAGDQTRIRDVLLTSTFAEELERFGATITSVGTAKKYGVEVRRLREYALVVVRSDGLPRQFSAALGELIRRKASTVVDISRSSKVAHGLLNSWLNGGQPVTPTHDVTRIEAFLDVEEGTLSRLLIHRRARIPCDQVLTRDVKEQIFNRSLPLDILPSDWTQQSGQSKRDTLTWIKENIFDADPYRIYIRYIASKHLRYDSFNSIMTAEFAKLVKFKTDDVPDPAIQRRKTPVPGERRQKTSDGCWELTSVKTIEQNLRRLVSALVDITDNGPDKSWLQCCGMGIFASSECVRAAFAQIATQRHAAMENAGVLEGMELGRVRNKRVYAEIDASLCRIIASWFDKRSGYFAHRRPTIATVPDLIDAAFVDRAVENWPEVAATAYDQLSRMGDDIADAAKKIRDPWHRIEPLLDMDEPLTPLFDAIDLMSTRRPGRHSSPIEIARHDRDQLIVHLLLQSRLRASNVRELTWRSDNNGQLRQDKSGLWFITLAQEFLKNAGSSALPPKGEDVVIELDPDDALLHETLNRYLLGESATRGVLLPDATSHAVFPGKAIGGCLTKQAFYKSVSHFSARYLVWFPWREGGIKGVLPFGPHSIRHLVATHVIKNSGTIEAAANALLDSVETLRKTYARFLSKDKSRITNRIIRGSVSRRRN